MKTIDHHLYLPPPKKEANVDRNKQLLGNMMN